MLNAGSLLWRKSIRWWAFFANCIQLVLIGQYVVNDNPKICIDEVYPLGDFSIEYEEETIWL